VHEALAPGEHIGHYTIEGELGRGPLGISYRARDAGGYIVALKVLESSTALTDPEKAQIARDFHALEDLQSPQIPVLLEFVRYDDYYVIATDFLPLGNLAARLERGPLALGAALTLIRHLAYAVGRAHVVGVVHGAIKPTNVLRREVEGRQVPVLGDFGGALRRHAWRTPDGYADAPDYRAPELGRLREATAAADVFALGKLLSAMVGPNAPAEVQRVVGTATESDPLRRYRNAHDMFTALTDMGAVSAPAHHEPEPLPEPLPEAAVEQHVVEPPAETEPEPTPALVLEPAILRDAVAPTSHTPSHGGRLLSSEGVAKADRGYRSKLPLLGLVIAIALAVLVFSIVLSGRKGSVFTGKTTPPGPPVATASAAYRSVLFSLQQPTGDASVIEVKTGTAWTQVGGTSYTLPTTVGGTRACATFRVADESQTPAIYSTETRACGTSTPPSLTVSVDRGNCIYAGYPQVCYTFLASGLKPGSTHTLTLKLNGHVLGTRVITVDKSGHAVLPKGEHFHFESTAGGETAQVTFGNLSRTFIVANV
jgi:serine/threonine-protein kinase PpkA